MSSELDLLSFLVDPSNMGQSPQNEHADYQEMINILLDCLKNNPDFVKKLQMNHLEPFQATEIRGEILLELIRLNYKVESGPIALLPMHYPLNQVVEIYKKFLSGLNDDDTRKPIAQIVCDKLTNNDSLVQQIETLESENKSLKQEIEKMRTDKQKMFDYLGRMTTLMKNEMEKSVAMYHSIY